MMQVQINFNESITSVTKKGNSFVVTTKKADGSQIVSCYIAIFLFLPLYKKVYEPKIVIVATGQETTPVIPKFVDQGLFKGIILHSSKYDIIS